MQHTCQGSTSVSILLLTYVRSSLTLHLVVFLGHFYTTWVPLLDLLAPPWTLLYLLCPPGMRDQGLWQKLLWKSSVILTWDQKTRIWMLKLHCINFVKAVRIYVRKIMNILTLVCMESSRNIRISTKLCRSGYPDQDQDGISSRLCSVTVFQIGPGRCIKWNT